jgi:formate hydrogenlyase subunit 4
MTPINAAVHVVLLLVFPPFLLGVINRTKAFFGGRTGPPLLQPYRDLARLMRKGLVFSTTTTWIFRAAPLVTLSSVLLAGLLIPLGPFPSLVPKFDGDLVLFAYLFGLARFFTTAAALDTGSAFEGMGAAREVTFACLAEPALFFAFLVLVKLSGSISLSDMLHSPLKVSWTAAAAPLVLVAVGLFVIILAENCRIPVDDPNTHLELTMIHEVMVLDHSGPLFGVILYAASLKLFVLSSVFLNVALPFQSGHPAFDWVIFVAQMIGMAVAVGVVESVMARLQMKHVPTLLIGALLFCAFGFFLLLR